MDLKIYVTFRGGGARVVERRESNSGELSFLIHWIQLEADESRKTDHAKHPVLWR